MVRRVSSKFGVLSYTTRLWFGLDSRMKKFLCVALQCLCCAGFLSFRAWGFDYWPGSL